MAEPAATLHEFVLLQVTFESLPLGFDEPRYDGIKNSPPAGCVPEDFGGLFGLRCRRSAPTLLEAVAQVCAEVRTEYGLVMTDLGVEKLWEWLGGGRDGYSATIVGQLLLMAAYRGQLLGYDTEDLVRFLRTSSG